MSITKRQQQILEWIDEQGFLTVERLAALAFTSPSSIRRDLAKLQQLCLIRRTHGGAGALGGDNRAIPFQTRLVQNTAGKQKIAKKAAVLLADGQTVMLDGSSTAGFLVPYIAKHKDITLFTNNMLTAINAINYGITTHCIGGASVHSSAVLAGALSYRAAAEIHTDILFFSSYGLSVDGVISDPTEEENYLRQVMLQNTKESVFLCDSEKFNRRAVFTLATLADVDVAVFDEPWEQLHTKCRVLD